jgi:hypothetical protein
MNNLPSRLKLPEIPDDAKELPWVTDLLRLLMELHQKVEELEEEIKRLKKTPRRPKLKASRIDHSVPKAFLTLWVSWIARQKVPDINSGMRVFRKDVVEHYVTILPDTFSFTITLTLAMLTNYRPVKFVPINYMARVGRSKIDPVRDTLRFITLILRTGMYFAPMRLFAPIILVLGLAWIIHEQEDLRLASVV